MEDKWSAYLTADRCVLVCVCVTGIACANLSLCVWYDATWPLSQH